jgi:hypothetical protein
MSLWLTFDREGDRGYQVFFEFTPEDFARCDALFKLGWKLVKIEHGN